MKTRFFVFFVFLVAFSCSIDEIDSPPTQSLEEIGEGYQVGHLRLKVSEEYSQALESYSKNGIPLTKSLSSSDLASMGIVSMQRVFPYAGEFEARTRAEGMHLWYDVEFDEQFQLTKAGDILSNMDGITEIEYRRKVVRFKSERVYDIRDYLPVVSQSRSMPFDDPRLPEQQHYYNDGSAPGSEKGCDINVFPTWEKYATGIPEVIVCIVDGGIDYNHEDLAQNMWKNEKGEYGYNFISGHSTIIPDSHGTHVAGTVAAVNNNGIGVSGVAGGNGDLDSGIRLMSAQIFVPRGHADENNEIDPSNAIKYGADNGAVISQNSWGYDGVTTNYIPGSVRAAVDYFIKYAGIDKQGNQTGPMKGGIVIFAAGNLNLPISAPGYYNPIICVASVSPDFKKTNYSHYGNQIDISAPGGDLSSFYGGSVGGILSTDLENSYTRQQGTSMACPHVSGVVALLVSRLFTTKGKGVLPSEVRKILLDNATPLNDYNPGYINKLGSGLVNVTRSIASLSTIAPEPVDDLSVAGVNSNKVSLTWTVPADADDDVASSFTIFYATQSLDDLDPDNPPSYVISKKVSSEGKGLGEAVSTDIINLKFTQEYYFVVGATDFSGNYSSLSNEVSSTTGVNRAPSITALDGVDVELSLDETLRLKFQVLDPDGHDVSFSLEKGSEAEGANISGDIITLTIIGNKVPLGKYTSKLIVADTYGAETSIDIKYTILTNLPPVVIAQPKNLVLNRLSETITFNLSDYIEDEDSEALNVTIDNTNPTAVESTYSNGVVSIKSRSYGSADITITATDRGNQEVEISFKVLCRNSVQFVDIYPNPVVDNLYLRTAKDENLDISIYNSLGAEVFKIDALSSSPFTPAMVDMSAMSAGVYHIKISTGNNIIEKNISKL